MKHLFIIIFTFLFLNASGQKISGIGIFQIGVLKATDMDKVADSLKFKKTIQRTFADYLRDSKDYQLFAEVFPDTISLYNSPPDAHLCKNVRVFYSPLIGVSGVILNELILTFYNNILVEISVHDASEVMEALKTKYGYAKIERTVKKVTCSSELLNNKNTYQEVTYTTTWMNGDIECLAVIKKYRDDKCQENTMDFVNIFKKTLINKITSCDKLIEDKMKQKENQSKKKELDKF